MSYFYISAAHKSSGKTTLSIGLCAALRARGLNVQAFKKGPDYIDPLWLSAASTHDCFNLDFYTMTNQEIEYNFYRAIHSADIGVIEGNKGLFDGLDVDGSNSNAALAKQLNAPVVLVIDCRGITRGIAPLLMGYQLFDKDVQFAGVILNRVGGARHEKKLRDVIERYTDFEILGAVYNDVRLEIDERHLGLMPSNESSITQQIIEQLGQAIEEQVDIDKLLAILPKHKKLANDEVIAAPSHESLRIGYAKDRAFSFYYPDDLQVFIHRGVELVAVDLINDLNLPEIDGLFIGGGFPEMAMQALSDNRSMQASIKNFIESNQPVYAECGGLMYLTRSLTWKNTTVELVGVIAANTVMHDRPQGRGYVKLEETNNSPWLVQQTGEICAHEFHYSALENLPNATKFAYKVLRGHGVDGHHDGIVYKNLLANYTHMHHSEANPWVDRFLSLVKDQKHKN